VAYEGGVKTTFWDGRLSSTLAVFRMTRENVVTADPAHRGFSVHTGEQRSQGIEWELGGQPLPGWQVIAAFTWLDAEVTKDNTFPVGQRIPGVPEFSVSLWNTYTLHSGPLRGFGGGFGIFYEDERSGQLVSAATTAEAVDLPSYVRGDIALFYRQKHYAVNLNFNNVTDARYFVGTFGRTQVFPGEPFNVTATVRLIFSAEWWHDAHAYDCLCHARLAPGGRRALPRTRRPRRGLRLRSGLRRTGVGGPTAACRCAAQRGGAAGRLRHAGKGAGDESNVPPVYGLAAHLDRRGARRPAVCHLLDGHAVGVRPRDRPLDDADDAAASPGGCGAAVTRCHGAPGG
jgi:hypothetical protein